jgi:cytochrome c-type biogenesis protein CcmH
MTTIWRFIAICALLVSVQMPAYAVLPDEILINPQLEQRARDLSAQLRCLVCQNQSIDDSMAPLARDLRLLVREHITRGESDEQIRAYLVARYGDFILLKPPLNIQTLLLWLSPALILLIGVISLLLRMNTPAAQENDTLSIDEQNTLTRILKQQSQGSDQR